MDRVIELNEDTILNYVRRHRCGVCTNELSAGKLALCRFELLLVLEPGSKKIHAGPNVR